MRRASRALLRSEPSLYRSCRRLLSLQSSNQVPGPPEASDEQIFTGGSLPKQEAVLGTEEEWQEAVERLERRGSESHSIPKNDAAIFASNRIGQVPLPPPLITSINAVLKGTHGPSLRTTSLRFYESMKLKSEGKSSTVPMPSARDFDKLESLAYLAGFAPQLYASCTTVLLELRKRLGQAYNPTRVLDCGLGPGTAALAFHETFTVSNDTEPPSSPSFTILQENDEMSKITKKIWADVVPKEQFNVVSRVNFSPSSSAEKYDVILAPHILGNFKGRPSERDRLVLDIWSRVSSNGGVLLLLERGNPLGFEHIARSREILLRRTTQTESTSTGDGSPGREIELGHIIAPCPHDSGCPLYHGSELARHLPQRSQWCHFSQRLQRPDFLQRLKGGKGNTEDVPFSYILIRKGVPRPVVTERYRYRDHTRSPKSNTVSNECTEESNAGEKMTDEEIVAANYGWPRIILPPLKRHKHILIDTCSPPSPSLTPAESGKLERHTVPKSQGASEYTFARKSHWGDSLPFDGKTRVPARKMDSLKERKEVTKRQAEKEKSRRDQDREKEEGRRRYKDE